ncbi:hypothetical protein [Rubrivirga sp.]|uniref:hypothetical protein n=1 Tax=Rubrivirga sp. TaxID=1885344 RepID=UPI003C7229B5
MVTAPTPRETRFRLNQMERYVRRHADDFGPRIVYIDSLLEVAYKSDHADFIAAEIREALATNAAPPQPSPAHA